MSEPKSISIEQRTSKVNIEALAPTPEPLPLSFLDRFPDILAAKDLKEIVQRIITAKQTGRTIICTFGAHVIKCGLSPILCELMRQDFIHCIATNGASVIHDVELALFGHTSEEVGEGLLRGDFGTTRETVEFVNNVIVNASVRHAGYGHWIGNALNNPMAPNSHTSLFATAYRHGCGAYVHVALGTDVNHMTAIDIGEHIGRTSFRDFQDYITFVGMTADEGVILNFGSAVIMPEVTLKAIALNRAMGTEFRNITIVDFDMSRQYRPMTRLVDTANLLGGKGYHITGHHELILPVLGALLLGAPH